MKSRPGFARLPWAALPLAAAVAGCSEPEDLGSIMLAVSTDMSVDKDVSRVDIVVQPESGATQAIQVNLFPELDGKFLPGTFSIVEGSRPGELVRVRVIARQGTTVRVVREAALQIPRRRTAVLSMPIQWLCDGEVRQEGQLYRSDCPESQTCVAGSCAPDLVDEQALPDYVPAEVFGGGSPAGGGECFDTLRCFEGASEVALDLASCTLDTSPSDDLNVALLLPTGSDGHCTSSDCWIPLDASPATGWSATADGARVRLPNAVCQRVSEAGAAVRVSHDCFSKSAATPLCGPWTLVGTEPGAEPPVAGVPQVVDNQTLAAQLQAASLRMARSVSAACAAIIGQSAPAQPSEASVAALCNSARDALGPLDWFHVTTRCWPDHERQLTCERGCDSSCEPGTLEQRCDAAALTGSCGAVCESRQCLGSVTAPASCAGACDGACSGSCEGDCFGQCDGVCAVPTPDGGCAGPCIGGSCSGLCQGSCEGSCQGTCQGDPSEPATACSEGSACRGGCAGQYEAAVCHSPLGASPCSLDAECAADCLATGRINVSCEPSSAWVRTSLTLDAAAALTIGDALAALLPVRDVEGATLAEEANRLAQELAELAENGEDPLNTGNALVRVRDAGALIRAAATGARQVLNAVGDPRPTPGPGGPALDCAVSEASGSRPMIDDFEDGNAQALVHDGRDGYWHVVRDDSGGELSPEEPPVPESGGAGDSGKAMHVRGSGFTGWGAGLDVDLRQGVAPHDASLHRGLSFWARGDTPLRVVVVQQDLSSSYACGTCAAETPDCGQYYGAEVPLTDTWTRHTLAWGDLVQSPVGVTPFDPDRLLRLKFEAPAAERFEFWLDDVAFY